MIENVATARREQDNLQTFGIRSKVGVFCPWMSGPSRLAADDNCQEVVLLVRHTEGEELLDLLLARQRHLK